MRTNLFFIALLVTAHSFAQWNSDATVNTSVTVVSKSQNNLHNASDANGGAIVSWDDNRNSATNASDIYAQRLNKSGLIKWAANGIPVCSTTGNQQSSAITDAGQGNVIIVWEDSRSGNYDIYAQKIDSSGNVLWAVNGVSVCAKSTNQKNPKVISDDNGGALIVWEDSVNNYWDVYAQRISASGAVLWTTTGATICAASNTQINPKIERDGSGGAIITWQDKRNNSDYDIFAQRIDNNGTIMWSVDGVGICNAINTQSNPRIEPDGSGGAIIGWIDKRNAVDYNIYGQRIDAGGAVQWAANGLAICSAAGNQSALDIKYIGAGGTVFSWKDARTATTSVYAQLVSLSGSVQLTADGIILSNGNKANNPNAISDQQNGCIIAWQDSSGTGWDIKTQRMNSLGAIQWTVGGVTVSNATNDQVNAVQVADYNGGAIYFWEDYRNLTDYNIYAHHLYNTGSPDVGIKESSMDDHNVRLYPNPIVNGSAITVGGEFDGDTWELSIFNAQGQLMKKEILRKNDRYYFNTKDFEPGIYFYYVQLNKTSSLVKGKFISLNQN
jgi:hypothetical protein